MISDSDSSAKSVKDDSNSVQNKKKKKKSDIDTKDVKKEDDEDEHDRKKKKEKEREKKGKGKDKAGPMHFTASSEPVAISQEGDFEGELPEEVFVEVRFLYFLVITDALFQHIHLLCITVHSHLVWEKNCFNYLVWEKTG